MTVEEIIRAWTDEEYRLSLSEEQLAQLPEHPAGLVELNDVLLEAIAGAGPCRYTDGNHGFRLSGLV
jgi:mersacidin/lichenicidin family type 2 lantibiotic